MLQDVHCVCNLSQNAKKSTRKYQKDNLQEANELMAKFNLDRQNMKKVKMISFVITFVMCFGYTI